VGFRLSVSGKARALVVFPPINDSLQEVTYGARFFRWYLRRFADEYTVYLVSRKRELPQGYTTPTGPATAERRLGGTSVRRT
jgi:hypothetical protein